MSENSKNILKFFSALAVVLLLIVGFLYLGKERDTRLTVKGSNPPQFEMSGSGTLGVLRITGLKKQREAIGSDAVTYWMIKAENGYMRVEAIENLSPLTYGIIPRAYVQTYPEQGETPLLVEGEVYTIFAETMGAKHGTSRFFIQDGKAIEMSN
jgi:hypothetical protein